MPDSPRADTIMRTGSAAGERFIHGEPTLEELLAEPIVHLTARKDGISIESLRDLCRGIREKLSQ